VAGALLLRWVRLQVLIGRPLGAHTVPLVERPDRGGTDGEAFYVVELDRQLFIGPVGPVQAAARWPLSRPVQDLGCQGRWNLRRSPRSPTDRKATERVLVIEIQPPLQCPHTDGRVLSHVAVRPSASSHEDRLTANT
jgi:hypothetical protein